MVVRGYPHLSRMARQVGAQVLGLTGLAAVVVLLDRHGLLAAVSVPSVTVTVLGLAISTLLGFRTTAAYARWWEARQLWGGLVNSSRTMARQAVAYLPDAAAGRRLVRMQLAFVHACRCALRRQDPWADVDRFVEPGVAVELRHHQNVPVGIMQAMGRLIAAAAPTEQRLQQLDDTVTALSNQIGGLERIKSTPLPRQYDVCAELFIYVYCAVLPVVMVDELRWLTPAVTAIVAAGFLILNRVGKNLEDPFEGQPYDVAMTAVCRTIEIDLRQAIGDADVPEAMKPDGGVLM